MPYKYPLGATLKQCLLTTVICIKYWKTLALSIWCKIITLKTFGSLEISCIFATRINIQKYVEKRIKYKLKY